MYQPFKSHFRLIIVCLSLFLGTAAATDFQITNPRPNTTTPGEVIEIGGIGADPAASIQIEVLTNAYYAQDGQARVNADGTWTYGPVYLSGKGTFNNHTIRATIIKNGQRGKSVTVSGIVRKQ